MLTGTFTVGHTSHIHATGHSRIFIKGSCSARASDEWVFAGRQREMTLLLFFIAVDAKHYPRKRAQLIHSTVYVPAVHLTDILLCSPSRAIFPFLIPHFLSPRARCLASSTFLRVISAAISSSQYFILARTKKKDIARGEAYSRPTLLRMMNRGTCKANLSQNGL